MRRSEVWAQLTSVRGSESHEAVIEVSARVVIISKLDRPSKMTQVVFAKSPLWVVGLRASVPLGLFARVLPQFRVNIGLCSGQLITWRLLP